jgi:hypothetical protein
MVAILGKLVYRVFDPNTVKSASISMQTNMYSTSEPYFMDITSFISPWHMTRRSV